MTFDDILVFDTETTGKPETAIFAPQSHETTAPVQTNVETEKCPQIENSPKISEIETQLLNETEF